MNIMEMAGHVSLSDLHNEISGVQGPFYANPNDPSFGQSAVIWLKNGYGVSITKGDNPMQIHFNPMSSDTAELMVVREINGGCGSVNDYANPVTSDVLKSITVGEITEALRKLSEMTNNPDDLGEQGFPH